MRFGFSTLGDLTWSLEQFAEALAQSEYDYVEIRGMDNAHLGPGASAERRQEVQRLFESAGVGILSVTGYTNFVDRARHTEELAKLRGWLQLAADIGARYVRVFGGSLLEGQSRDDAVAAVGTALMQAAADAENLGVYIALETHDGFSSSAMAHDVVSRVGSPLVCILWDIHHPLRVGETWQEAYDNVRDHLAYLHIKDAFPMPDGGEQLCLLGAGTLPVAPILQRLAKDSPEAVAVVEWEKAWHPELPDCKVAIPQHILEMRGYIGQ